MKERLIELIKSKSCQFYECPDNNCEECECIALFNGDIDKMADFILADGWIRPPYKVGQTVYALWETPTLYTETKYVLYCAEVKEIRQYKRNNMIVNSYLLEPVEFRGRRREYYDYDIGKTVFLTKKRSREEVEREKSRLQCVFNIKRKTQRENR